MVKRSKNNQLKNTQQKILFIGKKVDDVMKKLNEEIAKVNIKVEEVKNIRDRLLSDSIQVFTVFVGFLSLFIAIFVVSIEKIDITFLKKFFVGIIVYFTFLVSIWFILWIKRNV